LVDEQAAATSEILVRIFPQFGLQLSIPIAAALLTGLITDTLGFRTSNISPSTFLVAARLIETGVDLPDLYRRALIDRSFEAVRFWGAGLEKLERDGRLIWTSLTIADREKANYPGRDDADLINVLSSIEDTDISLIFVEQPNGNIKVSWRAQPGYDVSIVAVEFGGGGQLKLQVAFWKYKI
jgi:phosphoesterase RecJ-like protein